MTEDALIAAVADRVRAEMSANEGSHDWWHIQRVWNNARLIAGGENVDTTVVELAALLHDLADWKYHDGDLEAGPRAARELLTELGAEPELVERVADIVGRVSFKGAGVPDDMPSLEGQVVQDADRLDALGAIGVARAFAYGGAHNRPLHDPEAADAELHDDPVAYRNAGSATVAHFHEKLLLLADRMHTDTGRHLARARHSYMEAFLRQFHAEWNGQA